jgi:exopolysaccharide biosynthesis polyprenyl glycosylphosphotransferase
MSAFHSTSPEASPGPVEAPALPRTGPVEVLAGPRERPFLLRDQMSRRRLAGRVIIAFCVAYVAFRSWSSLPLALVQAVLVTLIWTALAHWAAESFRAMTFAAGAFVVSATTSITGIVTVAALDYWEPPLRIDREPLALVGLITFLAMGAWDYIIRRTATAPRRVLIVGAGPATARFLDTLDREPKAQLEVVAVVDAHIERALAARVPETAELTNLAGSVKRISPDLVVIAVSRGRPEVFGQLLSVADAGFQITGLPELYEFTFGRLPIEELTPAWFMSVLHAYNRPANRVAKRTFDVVVALIGIVVALPLVPVIVVLVKRTRGALLYRQTRMGENGGTFTMLKFRSMRPDAETNGEARWAAKGDTRVIPGGRLLRLLRLDELPQLWNVLRGEMSIVGPRPERPEFLDFLAGEVPFWTQRHLLKPGITGWAQIRAGYAADTLGTVEKLSYDLWYLRHRSIVLDIMICLKTLPRMATFRGAR